MRTEYHKISHCSPIIFSQFSTFESTLYKVVFFHHKKKIKTNKLKNLPFSKFIGTLVALNNLFIRDVTADMVCLRWYLVVKLLTSTNFTEVECSSTKLKQQTTYVFAL